MNELTREEMIVYDALYNAAERGEPCPLNIDIEMLVGFNSSSMGPKLVANIEAKGYVEVIRYQRFREVRIIATGKSTARSISQHIVRPHVPRGAGSRTPAPTDRKPYTSRGEA